MYYNTINLTKPIEVITGDYKQEWMDAKIINVIVQDSVNEDGNYIEISFVVECVDGCLQMVSDAFGWSKSQWRYKKEK